MVPMRLLPPLLLPNAPEAAFKSSGLEFIKNGEGLNPLCLT